VGHTSADPPDGRDHTYRLMAALCCGCLLACIAMLLISLWLVNRQASEMLYEQSIVQQQFLMKLMNVQDGLDDLRRRLARQDHD
jgi:hypothetical protein